MNPQQVFSISLCGVFYFTWHRHQIEGTNSFYSLFRKRQAKWAKRSCPSFEMATVVLNPGPFDRKSDFHTQMVLNPGPFDRKSDFHTQVVLNPGPFDRKVRLSYSGGFEPRSHRPKVRRSTTWLSTPHNVFCHRPMYNF